MNTVMPIKIKVKQCSICLDKIHMKADSCTTLCKHTFHKTCIDTWNKPDCPVCRQETKQTIVTVGYDDADDEAIWTDRVAQFAQQRCARLHLDPIDDIWGAKRYFFHCSRPLGLGLSQTEICSIAWYYTAKEMMDRSRARIHACWKRNVDYTYIAQVMTEKERAKAMHQRLPNWVITH